MLLSVEKIHDCLNPVLTISGERKEEKKDEGKGKNQYVSERISRFQREVTMPEGIKTDETKAEYRDGVLIIVLPKDETVKPKKVEVNVH